MEDQALNLKNLYSEAWRLTKAHLPFLAGYTLVLFLLSAVFSDQYDSPKHVVMNIFGALISYIVTMGLYRSVLLITSGIKPKFDQLYANWSYLISWVVANFLFGLILFVGLVLLIVPGLYFLATYGLFPFFILDKNLGPIEAMKASAQVAEGKRWPLLALMLSVIGVNMLGALCLVVGLLITLPLSALAVAIAYRRLTTPVALIDEHV
jgi:uncharacterized membrane protein